MTLKYYLKQFHPLKQRFLLRAKSDVKHEIRSVKGKGSSVDIATDCGLDGPGMESR
jgi:hypothetical protein